MKRIGLLGGMSWESSMEYYRVLNELVRERLGGLHSADCVMYSFDFAAVEELQRDDRWDEAAALLAREAQNLQRAGAKLLLLCTNTMHQVAGPMLAAVSIPLLHIADPTAERIRAAGLRTVGLLGTRYTMEMDFYRGRLEQRHGLTVLVPDEPGRDLVHRIIYEELVLGVVREESRQAYLRVIDELRARGAEAIILGCTEIDLLIRPEHCSVPLFDTTRIHCEAAVELALRGEPAAAPAG